MLYLLPRWSFASKISNSVNPEIRQSTCLISLTVRCTMTEKNSALSKLENAVSADDLVKSHSKTKFITRLPLLWSVVAILIAGILAPVFFYTLDEKVKDLQTEIVQLKSKLAQVTLVSNPVYQNDRKKRQAIIDSTSCQCRDGRDGMPGSPGKDGTDGIPGSQGPVGPPGQEGKDGTDGHDGMPGLKGAKGDKGLPGPAGSPVSPGVTGASYVRWGRSVCPTGATKLYDGILAGASYSHSGSGANHLCLPSDPQKGDIHQAGAQTGAYIYGSEYQTSGGTFARNLHDQDIPCAVCHIDRSSQVMIAGWKDCTKLSGWSLEYSGYVMAGHHSQSKADFVCVDKNPEAYPGGAANNDGDILYAVEVVCGSLPCAPYEAYTELPCAVCSK